MPETRKINGNPAFVEERNTNFIYKNENGISSSVNGEKKKSITYRPINPQCCKISVTLIYNQITGVFPQITFMHFTYHSCTFKSLSIHNILMQ